MTPNDVKIVADNIDDFIEVPNGALQLQKTLLALAVSGLLVPQLDKETVTLQDRAADGDLPYPLPSKWIWVQLENICNVDYGTRIVKGRNTSGKYDVYGGGGKTFTTDTFNRSDAVIVSRFGMSPYCVRKIEGKFYLNDSGLTVSGKDQRVLLQEYLDYVLFAFEEKIYLLARGVAQKNLYVDDFRKMLIPIPPLAEQKRIVEKLKEVLPKIPELSAKKKERDEIRTRFARSAMQSLGNGESKIAFEYLTELVKTPADLKELEGALLALAVSGKLVQRESRDVGVVSKHEERLAPPASDSISFDLPEMWRWAQFKDKNLLSIVDGDRGSNYPSKSEFTIDGYCLFLNTSNVRKGEFAFSKCDFITKEKDEILRKGKLVREDVVLTTRGTIGNTAYFSRNIPFDNVRINSGMVILRCDTTKIFPPYLIIFLNSSIFITQTNKLMSGSAQQQLPIRVLNEIYFPLPPLAEQKRIVKKVEEVMVLINRLKQAIGEK